MLFETYQGSGALVSSGREIWLPFAARLLTSLLLLWLIQVPLAWRLSGRLHRAQADREELLEKALAASIDERRRIAADLHDGPVQELAGLSYSLSAAAERRTDVRSQLQDAAARARDAIRGLGRCWSRSIRRTCRMPAWSRPSATCSPLYAVMGS